MSETKDNKQRNAEIHPEEGGSADSGQQPVSIEKTGESIREKNPAPIGTDPISHQTEEQEDIMIEKEFQGLLVEYLNSNHRKKVDIIERAFRFAKEAHHGIRRRSGEPYIMHPIAVARIVCEEMGLGSTSICSALLHDVVEDTEYTVEDIENLFGRKIAMIVSGLTKISGGIFGDQASAQAENFRKLGRD